MTCLGIKSGQHAESLLVPTKATNLVFGKSTFFLSMWATFQSNPISVPVILAISDWLATAHPMAKAKLEENDSRDVTSLIGNLLPFVTKKN